MAWTDIFDSDAFKGGLASALGVGAGAGVSMIPGVGLPLALGVGGQVAGIAAQTMGTGSTQTGPSDRQIDASETASRRATGARIEAQNRRGMQQARASAGARGVLGSGLQRQRIADINGATSDQYTDLEARLQAQRLGILSQRREIPVARPLAVAGRFISASSSPLAAYGAASLAHQGLSAGVSGGVDLGGRVNFGDEAAGVLGPTAGNDWMPRPFDYRAPDRALPWDANAYGGSAYGV